METKIINTLKDLMSFKTVKDNKEEFDKLFNYIKNIMPDSLYIKEYNFDGDKALVISNTESKDLDIIFCTHIDVVPASSYDYKEDDTCIYGRGTIDMKGSVAVCLELFKNLETDKKVALFITSDEEIAGEVARKLTLEYNSKLAIVPDGGNDFKLIKEEKGLLQVKIKVKTVSAHSSQPFNGVNAITTLFDVYNKLIEKYPLPTSGEDYRTSINLSKLSGGIANNQVPDYAEMVLDIRHTLDDTKEELINAIKTTNDSIEVEIIGSGSVFKTEINDDIKKYLDICKNILGRDIEIVGCESTSDAIYFSDKGIPTILMNPDGYYAHCPNEYVTKKSLVQLYEIYKKFIGKEG